MKKIVKKGLLCASICTLILSFTSCKFLLALIATTLETQVAQNEQDEDHIDLEDDGTTQYFASTDSFKKLEKFHGDLSKSASYRKLYTVQVNRAETSRNETGFVYPFDYKENKRAAGEETGLYERPSPVVDGMKNYTSPAFLQDFNNNPDKYINKATHNNARAGYSGYLDDDNFNGGSSGSGTSSPVSKYEWGKSYEFFVAPDMNSVNDGTKLEATLMEEGDHCYVFLATNETFGNETLSDGTLFCKDDSQKITKAQLQNIARSFDELYKPVTNVMGSAKISTPVTYTSNSKTVSSISETEEEKIAILIYDIFKDKMKGNVVGYFWAGDLFDSSAITYSNQMKMFYLDSYLLQNDLNSNTILCTSTLAHEFTHMLNTINKKSLKNDVWFTEMLAMTCEDIISKDYLNLDVKNSDSVFAQRLPYFNISFPEGFSVATWGDSKTMLSAYSNTYAFGAYLLRNYGGIKLINKIATNDKMNEEAITAALKAVGKSETFDSVLAKFGQVLINTESATTNQISLNKGFKETLNSVAYNIVPADLSRYWVYLSEEDKTNDIKTIGPMLQDTKYRYSLGGWGIEVKSFGDVTNYRTFDAQLPRNQSCDLYLYIK